MAMSGLRLLLATGEKIRTVRIRQLCSLFTRSSQPLHTQSACTLFRRAQSPLTRISGRFHPRRACLLNRQHQQQQCPNTSGFQPKRMVSTEACVENSESGAAGFLSLSTGGSKVQIPLIWLRDHCRCEVCYNASTHQKNVDNYSLDAPLWALEVAVVGGTLNVTWQDGHHSEYDLEWLQNNWNNPTRKVERFLWDGDRMRSRELPSVSYREHMETSEGLKQTLSNLLKYGFCAVQGAPGTAEGTREVAERISFVLETVYGTVSVMTSGVLDHSDTAYTSIGLGAHTDTTYYNLPAGVQIFHCLGHDGEGGETLLVDGFNAAQTLRQSNPGHFQTLTQTVVPHEYIEASNYHLYSKATVLATDSLGQLTHIRFNPYDRAPLSTVPPQDVADFYASYAALTRIIRDPASEFWTKLLPGTVLLVDNWRVMHGRSRFTGKRVLCGCYLPRDDWLSRARVMGLL